jgi:hypothetical protein
MIIGPHRWRKSSHSGTESNCVELAGTLDRVRDSKNPGGPSLRVDVVALLGAVRSGRFARGRWTG